MNKPYVSGSGPDARPADPDDDATRYRVVGALGLSHFLNDATQAILVPLYPLFKGAFDLSFTQIGLISLTYQLTASLLQPNVGYYTDRHPLSFSLPVGMILSLGGLVFLSAAPSYVWVLAGAALLGVGSSIFHPEASRMTRFAAGRRPGLSQAMFQVGGNAGTACGPVWASIILPLGQWSIMLFTFLPLAGIAVLTRISFWACNMRRARENRTAGKTYPPEHRFAPPVVRRAMIVLFFLMLSKDCYISSITNYLIFYLGHAFDLPVATGQFYLFVFLFCLALGTILGGPLGDRIGRKYIIWVSILGITPFTLLLPHVGLPATGVLVALIGLVLASATPAILVFAQELLPGHIGMVSGLFFGLSFGFGGLTAAVLGRVADVYGIARVYDLCSFMPLLGILAVLLPGPRSRGSAAGA
jgi:FSR family fosmidomycin resistance protein-like MFS transporter